MFTIIVSFPGNLAVAFFFGNLAAAFLFLGNLAAEVFLGQGGIFWLLEMRQKFLMQEFLGICRFCWGVHSLKQTAYNWAMKNIC